MNQEEAPPSSQESPVPLPPDSQKEPGLCALVRGGLLDMPLRRKLSFYRKLLMRICPLYLPGCLSGRSVLGCIRTAPIRPISHCLSRRGLCSSSSLTARCTPRFNYTLRLNLSSWWLEESKRPLKDRSRLSESSQFCTTSICVRSKAQHYLCYMIST
jgi:hypothetical protein